MAISRDAQGRIEDAQVQIARLREQVEHLMRDRVTPAVSDFAGRAEQTMNDASDMVRGQMNAASGRVREQPLMAVLVAAAVGWLVGRMMR